MCIIFGVFFFNATHYSGRTRNGLIGESIIYFAVFQVRSYFVKLLLQKLLFSTFFVHSHQKG